MGVCVEPPEYVAGLRPFEHWVFRTQPEGVASGPGDLDLTIYGLRKYCRLALKGSPTVLLLLFIAGEHVLERNPLGAELQALAPAFVSRRAGRAFLGYVDAQRRGLLGERHATRTRELSGEHGYDTKYAMHALRIAHQGRELGDRREIAPLRCAWCEQHRPDDDEPCPHCGRPRFRHKTADAAEFSERRRDLDERGL